MAIKDSIVNLKKGLRTTLTNVPALIDTLVRGLDGVEEAAEEENTYSTDERVVGTWIDGSTVYEKTIDFGTLPNAAVKSVQHGITNFKEAVEIKAVGYSTITFMIPYIYGTKTETEFINIYVDNSQVVIFATGDRSAYKAYVTIRYIKTNAS